MLLILENLAQRFELRCSHHPLAELRFSLSLRMALVLVRGALILILGVTSWLQCGSLSLLAQILVQTF